MKIGHILIHQWASRQETVNIKNDYKPVLIHRWSSWLIRLSSICKATLKKVTYEYYLHYIVGIYIKNYIYIKYMDVKNGGRGFFNFFLYTTYSVEFSISPFLEKPELFPLTILFT